MGSVPRDIRRSALRFGESGGCRAGCADCKYLRVCEGGREKITPSRNEVFNKEIGVKHYG